MAPMTLSTWLVGHRHFHFDLREEAHRIFGPTVDFRVTLLTPVSLDLGDSQPLHPDGGQSVADLVEFERLDNGHDDFHGFDPRLSPFLNSRSAGGFTEPDPKSALRGHSRVSRIKRRARCRPAAYQTDPMNEFLRREAGSRYRYGALAQSRGRVLSRCTKFSQSGKYGSLKRDFRPAKIAQRLSPWQRRGRGPRSRRGARRAPGGGHAGPDGAGRTAR